MSLLLYGSIVFLTFEDDQRIIHTGSILERKNMHAIFQKKGKKKMFKKGEICGNLGKNVQNLNILKKGR